MNGQLPGKCMLHSRQGSDTLHVSSAVARPWPRQVGGKSSSAVAPGRLPPGMSDSVIPTGGTICRSFCKVLTCSFEPDKGQVICLELAGMLLNRQERDRTDVAIDTGNMDILMLVSEDPELARLLCTVQAEEEVEAGITS